MFDPDVPAELILILKDPDPLALIPMLADESARAKLFDAYTESLKPLAVLAESFRQDLR